MAGRICRRVKVLSPAELFFVKISKKIGGFWDLGVFGIFHFTSPAGRRRVAPCENVCFCGGIRVYMC